MPGISAHKTRIPPWLIWLLKTAIGGGLIAWMLLSGRLDLRLVARSLTRGYGLFIAGILLMVTVPMIGSLRWWWLLRLGGMRVSFLQAMRLTWIGAFFNTFLPGATGGDVLRVYGAAKAFPQKRPEAVLSVIADRLTGLISLVVLALAVLVLNYRIIAARPFLRETALILGVAWTVLALVTLLLMSRRTERILRSWCSGRKGPVSRGLMRMDRALAYFRGRRLTLLYCMSISIIPHLCAVAAVYLAASVAGESSIPFARFLFMVPIILAINGIPASPGGVGQGEGFAEVIFKSLGSTFGAEAFLVFRLMMMLAWMAGAVGYLTGSVRFDVAETAARDIEDNDPSTDTPQDD